MKGVILSIIFLSTYINPALQAKEFAEKTPEIRGSSRIISFVKAEEDVAESFLLTLKQQWRRLTQTIHSKIDKAILKIESGLSDSESKKLLWGSVVSIIIANLSLAGIILLRVGKFPTLFWAKTSLVTTVCIALLAVIFSSTNLYKTLKADAVPEGWRRAAFFGFFYRYLLQLCYSLFYKSPYSSMGYDLKIRGDHNSNVMQKIVK